MDNQLYDYSAIVDRPRLTLPDGARVAFWIGLNIEHYEVDKPSTSIFAGTAALQPDPLNYGWRDYGPRVGDLAHVRRSGPVRPARQRAAERGCLRALPAHHRRRQEASLGVAGTR